jgi:hypothetical protein
MLTDLPLELITELRHAALLLDNAAYPCSFNPLKQMRQRRRRVCSGWRMVFSSGERRSFSQNSMRSIVENQLDGFYESK